MEIKNDTQFRDQVIAKVTVTRDGGFELKFEDGWLLSVQNDKRLPIPETGQTVRTYGKGLGFPVRGVVVGEYVYRYQTEAEEEAARKEEIRKVDENKRQRFEENLPQWEADLKALPRTFRQRIERFLRVSKDWSWEFGPYEMFSCKEACKIIDVLSAFNISSVSLPDQVEAFHASPIDSQKKLVPDMDYEEHSGNTFGAACKLAHMHFHDPELIPHAHGALCPMVGCDIYGCYTVHQSVKAAS